MNLTVDAGPWDEPVAPSEVGMEVLAIERRMDEIALQLEDTGDTFDGPRSAKRVANQRFRGGKKRETVRRQAKRAPPVANLDAITLRGGD